MKPKQGIVLLGATGSVGQSTLEVLRKHSDKLELLAIAAHSNTKALAHIAEEFNVPSIGIFSEKAYTEALASNLFKQRKLFYGLEGLCELASLPTAHTVMMAIVGTYGLKPALAAIKKGKRLALANKEILVMAGEYIMQEAKKHGSQILPVDSEHSGIFQCLKSGANREIHEIILTASGGAFRDTPLHALKNVTVQEALQHPTWNMGPKITLDCATMANKGLELIEAQWLFNCHWEQLDAVIHPQSIIHSLVTFIDGSSIAQLAKPSMILPIQYALLYPERMASPTPPFDFKNHFQNLEFRPLDPQRYPCFTLAKRALQAGKSAPAIFNAANEVAVEAFIQGKISYLQIPQLIDKALQTVSNDGLPNLEAILWKHDEALQKAKELIHGTRNIQHTIL